MFFVRRLWCENLTSPTHGPISYSAVDSVARLRPADALTRIA